MGNLDSLNYDPVFRTSSLDFSNWNGIEKDTDNNLSFYIRNGTKYNVPSKNN